MVIPISGFLPVPLPMMIPFMGAQSLVIGKMFGEGFQYGKRKISAMPNEEFNKLTFEDMMSNAREEIKASVPTMNAAMQDMKPMVDIVVREFLQYINEISKTLQELTVTGIDEAAHLIGTHIHPEATAPPAPIQPTPTPTNPQLPFSPTNPTPFTPKAKVDRCQATWNIWNGRQLQINQLHKDFRAARNDVNNAAGNPRSSRYSQAINKANTIKTQLTKITELQNAGLNNPNNKDCAARWIIPR